MAVLLIILGCLIIYGKSRYFPDNLSYLRNQLKKKPKIVRSLGYLLFLGSYLLFSNQLGWGTAIVVFITTLSFGLCLVLIVLPLHKKYVYILGVFSLLIIIVENSI